MTALEVAMRPAATRRRAGDGRLAAGLVVLAGLLLVVCFFSITMGARDITLTTIWHAMTDFDPTSSSEIVVREMRVPRTLIGIFAGMAFGLSGAILQGITRNPLADPGIMGINAGAAALMVTGIAVFGTQDLSTYLWLAFLGAGAATVIVYGIASMGREGATPVKLALAGAAITAGLTSITTAIVLYDIDAYNEMRTWQVGALAGRYMPIFWHTAPFILVGVIGALAAGKALNGLALGEDVAVALGQRVRRTRLALFALVSVLCGAATAACGPIVFLGLIVPHMARLICGPSYRWILPYTLLLAPIVLLLADIVGRFALGHGELQVGVVLGVLGAPVFIAIVRYRSLTEL